MELNEKVFRAIQETDGKVFGVKFIKKDGSLRDMACRLKVRKGVTGAGRKFEPKDYGLVGVYDMNNGFRMVNTNTVIEFTFKGIVTKF